MKFSYTEEQELFRNMARQFLAEVSNGDAVRRAMTSDNGIDDGVWARICEEHGWPAVIIPEEYGGFGFGWVELGAVLEEAGRALLCAPLFSTTCLGANALVEAGNHDQKSRFLPDIASGELVATLAHAGPDEAIVWRDGRLHGRREYVVDGHVADVMVVAADGDLFIVERNAPGLMVIAQNTLDATRRLASLQFDGVEAERLAGHPVGQAPIDVVLARAAIGLACEQVGAAEACLDMSVAYAKVRTQFGRAIGSFQAIKHKCADMLVKVESARSAVWWAAWAAANSPDELLVASHIAKATASEALWHCAAESLQIHGGIGFTWEQDCHLYLKRAQGGKAMLGTPAWHREQVAARVF
jgi:alkylation response protein AidB-like acyl-CoA dehydrogenase